MGTNTKIMTNYYQYKRLLKKQTTCKASGATRAQSLGVLYSFFMHISLKYSCIIALMAVFTTPVLSKNIVVKNADELRVAAAKALPGDELVIANGNYKEWACELVGHGTANAPIIIRPETPGRVVFTGTVLKTMFLLSGSYLQLQGLVFEECVLHKAEGSTPLIIELRADHSRITACSFKRNEVKSQFMPIVAVTGIGEQNRIDHCQFIGNVNNMDIQVRVAPSTVPLNTLIDHNEFVDKPRVTWPVFNGGECVQIGQDPVLLGTKSAFATVRDNRFIRCKAEPEVISNKSSGNQYIHNYLEDCEGELVMRGGHDCLVDSNTFKGGICGIRVNGSHHVITHNIISHTQTAIRLMYGMSKGKDEVGFYVAATNCLITGNQISNVNTGILLGDSKDMDWTGKFDTKRYPSRTLQDIPPADNTIKDNVILSAGVAIKK